MDSAAFASTRTGRKWLNGLLRFGGATALLPFVLPVVGSVLLIVQARTLAQLLDRAIMHAEAPEMLGGLILALGVLMAMRAMIGSASELAATQAAERIKVRLRALLAAAMLRRRPAEMGTRASGALSAALIEQVDAIDSYLVRYLPAMLQASILPLVLVAVIAPVDWLVALLLLITIPLIPLFMALIGWGADAASRRQAGALARLGGRFADRLRGMTTLVLFGREAAEIAAVRDASEELRRRTMRVMRIAFLSSAILEFFAALGVAGVALYVGLTFLGLVSLRGGAPLSLEAGLFCLLMAPEVYAPLRLLAAHYHDRAAAKAGAEEIARQFGGLPAIDVPAPVAHSAPVPDRGPVHLELSGVGVLTPTGRTILRGINLDLQPGQALAVMGESGAGKSTLLETIARLRDFSGTVRLDGAELTEFAEPELRQRVAMLGQRPRLFVGSIAENIGLGRPSASRAEVERAACRARVTAFSDALPRGLDTLLGDDGLGLSGGECQRVALARLFLRDPGLVLLDEPTAHLDAETELQVLDELLAFARGRTLIVATHSAAVASRFERVMRVSGGTLLPAVRVRAVDERRGAA